MFESCVSVFLQKLSQQIAMTDDESEGETAATTSDVGDSSAKRRLRNRRLNLNKLSREDHVLVFNGVYDSQCVQVSHSAMFSKFFIFSNTPLVLNRQKITSYLQG